MSCEDVDTRLARLEEMFAAHVTLIAALRVEDQRALKLAYDAAKELADKHNDLIHAAERRDEQYARKDDVDRVVSSTTTARELLERRLSGSVSQDVYDEKHAALEKRVDILEKWQANLVGRTVGLSLVGGIAIAIVTALITHLLS